MREAEPPFGPARRCNVLNRFRLLTLAVCLAGLGLGEARAQLPNLYSRPATRPPRARLSPYLNLIRGQDRNVDLAVDYYLGVIPERERRFNAALFDTRINDLERGPLAPRAARDVEDIVPEVPTAGRPIGSRASADYFRADTAATTLRRPPQQRR
jgi:hypothetical protein